MGEPGELQYLDVVTRPRVEPTAAAKSDLASRPCEAPGKDVRPRGETRPCDEGIGTATLERPSIDTRPCGGFGKTTLERPRGETRP